MEINNVEYFRVLKNKLNLVEPKLHRNVITHISTTCRGRLR